ncbi:MAG: FkbM family methyltransferase [Blastocatellia bacterium]|nr:FkbM family methyltransferase [Blastocatellia bacterium]
MPRLAYVLLPYTRAELPGWGFLLSKLHILGNQYDHLWKDAPKQKIKGKWHGYWMNLNLADWSERMTFFLGRYYELDIQLLLQALLKPGERFVDIGANIGMIMLQAAAIVTESGSVECFEPNPECIAVLKETLRSNRLPQVTLHEMGLADTATTFRLNLTSDHTGTGSMTAYQDEALVQRSYEVEVKVGDEVLRANPQPVKLLKIDVEGFEYKVLKGLTQTLTQWRPFVVTEFVQEHLERGGSSRAQVADFMCRLGYDPYGITTERVFFRHRLQLVPLLGNIENTEYEDVLWIHSKTSLEPRLSKTIALV